MKRSTIILSLALTIASAGMVRAATLDDIKARGSILCGVSGGLAGFARPDDKGTWTGIDVEFCRALAAAIFNDPTKVKFLPLTAKDRFTALTSREVDVLSRNTTWTSSRDTQLGFNFAGVIYYDAQGFMVRKAAKVASALELSNTTVCTQSGTTTQLNLADYFRSNNMKYEAVVFNTADEVIKAYESGRCDVFTTDVSQIYAERLKLPKPDEHMILPELISKEPLGPLVRHGDDQWFDIVKFAIQAMVVAEHLGITQQNVEAMRQSRDPTIRRFLGLERGNGQALGLSEDWAYAVVREVGNYGEVYERNVGKDSPLKIDRGLNRLQRDGGLMLPLGFF